MRQRARMHPGACAQRVAQRCAQDLRGRQHAFDVYAEPTVDRVADHVAADEHDQQRRTDGHTQKQQEQAQAETCAKHPTSPFHDSAHDVAPEIEQQNEEDR